MAKLNLKKADNQSVTEKIILNGTLLPKRPIRWELFTIPLVFVAFIAAWYGAIAGFGIQSYILPTPDQTAYSLWYLATQPTFWGHVVVTLREAAIGFLLGTGTAIFFGTFISTIPIVRKTLLPYIIGWQSVPHLPLAPLLVVWFGFGETSKVLMAAIVAFFPIFVAIIDGLNSSKQAQLDMLRVFGGRPLDIFLRVRLPNALPYFFTGVNVGVIMALLGAVVAEWIGASAGLGHLLLAYNYDFQISSMFGVLIYLGAFGICLHSLVRLARKKLVFWEA